MFKCTVSEADVEALRYGRFHHSDPRVQVRREALYWRSQRVANRDILRLCGLSKASFHRDRKGYVTGRIEQLKQRDHDRPHRELTQHRSTLAADCRAHPPATVAEAAARIQELTGIARKPTQVRQFMKALGRQTSDGGDDPSQSRCGRARGL